MSTLHSTDQFTLIEQSVNHKNTLIEQSFYLCFVAEIYPPASGETLPHRTSNVDNHARLDMFAKEF